MCGCPPLNLSFKLNRTNELVRTQKRITLKGYHVNFLPAAHQLHPPCLKPPARQSPSSPACPLPSAHRPLVRRLSQANPSAACAGLDRIVRQAEGRRILLVDGKGKQGSHALTSYLSRERERESCVLPACAPASGEKDGRVRSEIKRHKQGARGHTLVCLAAALPSTRPPPLASLLYPIVYQSLEIS